ncbi:tRNA wybutosine-synthesizing protein 2 homolog isoform X2 [Clarias gariepinus]|uniref:tRNA wybutosine-synthesizing protein 2 homolog isoform X2 n=1 Tax=Clarias gariepinus TaxID=13013 RepID=UPI00234D2364|nr:tRNA wybutosine-synthesizing protein 2 homolog isoform X2 [Clarias gariepinus]
MCDVNNSNRSQMDCITALKVPQRHAQLYKKHLSENGALDQQYCVQKHTDGTVTIPVFTSTLSHLDPVTLQSSVAPDSFCEIVQLQDPQLSKKSKAKPCRERMIEVLQDLVATKGLKWSKEFEDDIPNGWQRHGDLLMFGDGCFSQAIWKKIGSELWLAVAQALGVTRLAQIKHISQDGWRTPMVTMLLGDNSYVTHIDNHIRYEFDVTKCMFSFGNITEKLRISSFDCSGETVVDLYAGIGYFTLPYLVHARAAHVHACEWNPDAVSALRKNLHINKVAHRCTVHQGDNKQLSLTDLADRVNLGLIPSSEEGWPVACRLLRKDTGGILHIHNNVTTPIQYQSLQPSSSSMKDGQQSINGTQNISRDREVWNDWAKNTAIHIVNLLRDNTRAEWSTSIKHIEHVKSYAPHIHHIVLDLECRPVKYVN